jgi:hypothetical protein
MTQYYRQRLIPRPDDGSSKYIKKVGKLLPDYTAPPSQTSSIFRTGTSQSGYVVEHSANVSKPGFEGMKIDLYDACTHRQVTKRQK